MKGKSIPLIHAIKNNDYLKMIAGLITTPTEMRSFIGSHDASVSYLVTFTPESEPIIRHAGDAIFDDLQYIDAGDSGLVSSYLDSIAEPLDTLRTHGVAILAISIKGKMKLHNDSIIDNWERTYFFIVSILGYFRVKDNAKNVHCFSPSCDKAMRDLLDAAEHNKKIAVWLQAKLIRDTFENDVPWCADCCLPEMIAICGNGPSVRAPQLRITSDVVERAIADAETLLRSSGSTSALDRVHTTLHGYLETVCNENGIPYDRGSSITELFRILKQSHPSLNNLGVHQAHIVQVLRSLNSVVDALNPARNRGSLAHPNEILLDNHEATLFINATRTILQYLDAKFSG